jgi:hypothetical protein
MRLYWRMGFPGWQFAANCGLPIKIKIEVHRDEQAGVYYACSDDIGLSVEAESLDGLITEIDTAIPVLLEVEHSPIRETRTDIRLHGSLVAA